MVKVFLVIVVVMYFINLMIQDWNFMNVMRVANDIMNNMCYIINVIFDESEEFKTLVGIFNEDAANKILKQLRNITPRYGTMRIDVEAYNINEILIDLTGI